MTGIRHHLKTSDTLRLRNPATNYSISECDATSRNVSSTSKATMYPVPVVNFIHTDGQTFGSNAVSVLWNVSFFTSISHDVCCWSWFWPNTEIVLTWARLAGHATYADQLATCFEKACRQTSGARFAFVGTRPVSSLGQQEGQRFVWEGANFFELFPIVSNYIQHIFPGGKNFSRGAWLEPASFWK